MVAGAQGKSVLYFLRHHHTVSCSGSAGLAPHSQDRTPPLLWSSSAAGGVGIPDAGRSDKRAVGAWLLLTAEAEKIEYAPSESLGLGFTWAAFYKYTRVSSSLLSPFMGLRWASSTREPHTADNFPFCPFLCVPPFRLGLCGHGSHCVLGQKAQNYNCL